MNLDNISHWNIFIDDVDGELCMDRRKGHTGRVIEVVALEEVKAEIGVSIKKLTNQNLHFVLSKVLHEISMFQTFLELNKGNIIGDIYIEQIAETQKNLKGRLELLTIG